MGLGINISAVAERSIIDYIKELKTIWSDCTSCSNDEQNYVNKKVSKNNKDKMGLPEFESGSLAPKAKRMDQATPQALCRFCR